ncbi:YihY family inner membrane protein [Lysobacter soyae]|uniref:UPF0761 membrane protein H8L67_03215 n=1 Tax=Lysobacter soyae TaxID=2764185 RepID=A0ABX8WRS9_9GAMM|nr:YihY family inner membrane protein [Lysobacter sp. CJ11]QYR53528.1 YihY family inner membrane protein [Lysobacter sp. CJ11]
MDLRERLHIYHHRITDPIRRRTFLRFVAERFWADRLFESAGSLAYTTVFALVPLATVVFGMLSAFPVFAKWRVQLSDYIFSNFVPSSAREVEKYVIQFSDGAAQLTTAGIIALVISLLITLTGLESTFNRIWRVSVGRPKFGRFLVYWTVLTLGSLIAVASLALSSKLFALTVFESAPGQALEHLALRITPLLIEFGAFAVLYKVVPHRTVKWAHAFGGAIFAVAGFELVKWGIGAFIGNFSSYSKLYGALAFVPIFLLWMYLVWVSVLLGASFASSLSAFRYQPASQRLPEGFEIYGMLRMLGRFHLARKQGHGMHSEELQRLDPMLTDALVQDMLGYLNEVGIVQRNENGEWFLSRDLDEVNLQELYVAGRLRVPVHEAHLPCHDDPLGKAVLRVIDDLRLPMREKLKRRVSSIYEGLEA